MAMVEYTVCEQQATSALRMSEVVRKPRVLLISADEFSGSQPALEDALRRAGCNVTYVRLSLKELGLRRHGYRLGMVLSAVYYYGRNARRMLERTPAAFVARSRACQAVVARHPEAELVMLIAANFQNYCGSARPAHKRFVVYTDYMNLLSKALPDYGFPILERRALPQWNELERQVLHAQDHIFVMGAHLRPAIASAYQVPESKITVVGAGPGIDIDIERDGEQKPIGSQRILFVGRLAEIKGLATVVKALGKVRERFPHAELDVVGATPVAGAGIVYHGTPPPARIKALFYDASIFTMPSFKEPFGLVFVEAMLAKNACIGSTIGSMPELVKDGENGFLIEPGNHTALAEKLIAMLNDPEGTRQMGERGYRRVKASWSWDLVAQRMLQVWDTQLRIT
jgi:glycosyltransferase involved in cell wall biosynthesis